MIIRTRPGVSREMTISLRTGLLLAVIAGLLTGLAIWSLAVRDVSAQTQLTLADFDDTGLDVETLALIQVVQQQQGNWTWIYADDDFGPHGSLVDGSLLYGPTTGQSTIGGFRHRDVDNRVRLDRTATPASVAMTGYYQTGGGSDLTLYLQTGSQTLELAMGDATFLSTAENRLVLNYADGYTMLSGLNAGDRLIVAFARPAPDPPAQVTGVSATANDHDSITVEWDAVTDADGYVVEWDTDSAFGTSSTATISSGSTTTYTITGLDENTQYHVRVKSTKTSADDGDVSTSDNATTELQPPAQVTNVSATADDHDSITLEWDAAARATGYLVEWGTTSGSYTDNATASGTSYSITGLDASATYYIRVTALRTNADDGPASTEDSATTSAAPIPAPAEVTGVDASAASATSIDVEWDAASDADGYRIEWGTTSGTYTDDDIATDTSYTITGLSASTTYYVRVVATRTGAPDGTPSDETSATTNAPPPPAQVTGATATADDHDSITVEWNAVTNADGYVVEWDIAPNFANANDATIGSGSTTSYSITGLDEDTTYYVRVYATKAGVADGAVSSTDSATTTLQPPARVTGLSAMAVSDTEIDLSWANAVRAGGYTIQWGTASQTFDSSREVGTSTLSQRVSQLVPDTSYYFRVVSTRPGAPDGPPSLVATARTSVAPTPGQPTGVAAVAISDREIQVEWNPAQNATGYRVQWDLGSGFPDPKSATVFGAGVVIEDLQSETEYFVRVTGTRAGAPDSALSAPDSAITHEAPVKTWSARFPGGPVGAQLALALFAGIMAGVRVRSDKTPQREVKIVVVMCAGSLILPAFGIGNIFWTGGIVLLIALATGAVYFLARR